MAAMLPAGFPPALSPGSPSRRSVGGFYVPGPGAERRRMSQEIREHWRDPYAALQMSLQQQQDNYCERFERMLKDHQHRLLSAIHESFGAPPAASAWGMSSKATIAKVKPQELLEAEPSEARKVQPDDDDGESSDELEVLQDSRDNGEGSGCDSNESIRGRKTNKIRQTVHAMADQDKRKWRNSDYDVSKKLEAINEAKAWVNKSWGNSHRTKLTWQSSRSSLSRPSCYCKGFFASIIKSRPFELLVSLAIAFNAASIAAQLDHTMRCPTEEPWAAFSVLDKVFITFFTVELGMRFMGEGHSFFLPSNPQQKWNLFDLLLMTGAYVEVAIGFVHDTRSLSETSDVAAFRLLRTMRLVRVLRVVRVMSFFRDLRIMVTGITNSLYSMMWAVLLLLAIMFMFAMCVLQYAADETLAREMGNGYLSDEDYDRLMQFYGSLIRTIYTLYLSICGGLDWSDAAEPLVALSAPLGLAFSAYVAFAVLCVLNIITGVFVESATKMSAQDQDIVLMEDLEARKKWIEAATDLFDASDVHQAGYLCVEEFVEQLKDVRMQALFRKVGVDTDSVPARGLFELLDFDGDGKVGADEFVLALQQVHGMARNIDLARVIHETRTIKSIMGELVDLCLMNFDNVDVGPRFAANAARIRRHASPIAKRTLSSTSFESEKYGHSMGSDLSHTGELPNALD